MANFSDIVKRGRRNFDLKKEGGSWNRCEECDVRAICYPYVDERKEVWILCEECTNEFVRDE